MEDEDVIEVYQEQTGGKWINYCKTMQQPLQF